MMSVARKSKSRRTATVEPKPNPAPFNTDVLHVIKRQLTRYPKLLDPFAGTGKGCDFMAALGHQVVGVELEPEWACQSKYVEVGNALHLRWRASTFDAVFTSPTYGNRMADHHDAKERCKPCGGVGYMLSVRGKKQVCEKCGGEGRRKYKRHTYKHYLERDPSEDSSAVMQWGPAYREFHEKAWKEIIRVIRKEVLIPDDVLPGRLVLNMKDHERDGVMQPVTKFHCDTIKALGMKQVRKIAVPTQGLRHGQNHEARDEQEWVIVFDKAA